jgi:UMF1 family MFS transporter
LVGFGLYALAGKATSFIAPLSIGIVTRATGSQQPGITPPVVLFLIGLILMCWVKPEGQRLLFIRRVDFLKPHHKDNGN